MPVTVTETAARRIDQIIAEHGFEPSNMKLRVGVKGGGCSGFNYTLDLTEVQKDSDEVWNFTYDRTPLVSTAALAEGGHEDQGGGGTATATATGLSETFTVTIVCDPKSYRISTAPRSTTRTRSWARASCSTTRTRPRRAAAEAASAHKKAEILSNQRHRPASQGGVCLTSAPVPSSAKREHPTYRLARKPLGLRPRVGSSRAPSRRNRSTLDRRQHAKRL